MLTAYDYPTAALQDEAGIDVILVGDSVGTNVLGYRSPQEVTMADMVHHARAVRRGVERAFLLVDMPFMSYQPRVETAVANAGRLVQQVVAGQAPGLQDLRHLGFGIPLLPLTQVGGDREDLAQQVIGVGEPIESAGQHHPAGDCGRIGGILHLELVISVTADVGDHHQQHGENQQHQQGHDADRATLVTVEATESNPNPRADPVAGGVIGWH